MSTGRRATEVSGGEGFEPSVAVHDRAIATGLGRAVAYLPVR